jgi:hypothetical protein
MVFITYIISTALRSRWLHTSSVSLTNQSHVAIVQDADRLVVYVLLSASTVTKKLN